MRYTIALAVVILSACSAGTPPRQTETRAALYLRDTRPQTAEFLLPGLGHSQLDLHNLATQALSLDLACDGPVRLVRAEEGTAQPRNGRLRLTLDAAARGRWRLELGETATACTLDVAPRNGATYRIEIRREAMARPVVARIDATPTACIPASGKEEAPPLLAPFNLSQTCAVNPGPVTLQSDSRAAFQAKVVALTGRPLPDAVLDSGDAGAAIDFSKAPKLDLITLSYLHIRADFTGWMIARMLAFHANRGTVVRVLVSDAVMTRKDRAVFEHLAAQYPGIQLQFYRAPGWGAGRIHRVNHIKLFAVVGSKAQESVVMLGGRNLHDGFVFQTPRDLSAFPFLHQYDPKKRVSLYFFNSYQDLDILLRDDATARKISAHFARLWHRNPDSGALPPEIATQQPPDPRAGLRHVLSLPQQDGKALEQLYVDLFDRARGQVQMTSPFLNLPPRIAQAMERALDRGVEVELVTRIEMPDPSGFLATTLNRMFIRDHARVKVWAYPSDTRTLHSKYVLVDGKLGFVTSTNLNRRSFAHDTENGALITDRAALAQLAADFARIKAASDRIGPDVPIKAWRERIISIPLLRGVF